MKNNQDISHFCENELFRSQLTHHRLQLRATYVIFKRSQVELAGRAVKNTYAELLLPCFLVLFTILTEGYAVACLFVCKERLVHKRAIREDLVELPACQTGEQRLTK